MAAEPPLVVPDVLLAVDTSSLKGLLEAILARLRLSEASLAELQNERHLDLPKQGLVARIDKLELEVDALLNDEIPGVDGPNCPSPRSLRWESCMNGHQPLRGTNRRNGGVRSRDARGHPAKCTRL
ncbi:unnamed protein product [Symbiodinium sp. CCMP2592]|nr:unnamed protein product [Symbiodinium sp. CCMP2592]